MAQKKLMCKENFLLIGAKMLDKGKTEFGLETLRAVISDELDVHDSGVLARFVKAMHRQKVIRQTFDGWRLNIEDVEEDKNEVNKDGDRKRIESDNKRRDNNSEQPKQLAEREFKLESRTF